MSGNEGTTPKEQLKADLADVVFDKAQWSGRGTDWFLQWLVDFVSRTNISISVSLTVGGNMVSGMLISHNQYFETMSEKLSSAFEVGGEETVQGMKDIILSFRPQPHAGEEENAPQYLHLAEAKTYAGPNGAISSSGVLWRGKISAVEGFTFGKMS